MSARCEALLFAAARADHVERTIKPALERGAVVLSTVSSTRRWRIKGRPWARRRGRWSGSTWAITDGVIPDLTIMLDLPTGTSTQRDGDRPHGDRTEGMAAGC